MTVSVHDVRHALKELGKLRFGEMRVEEAMHQIVQTTHAIFSVDGAGLMLTDVGHQLRNAAVSDARMAHLEELQVRHQEGPCITAFEDKQLVGSEDLTAEPRWPSFSRDAVARGVRAVLASPIPYNQDAVGVVAVLSEQRHPWAPEAELALLAFTDLAALLIATMMMGEQQTELATQLQAALNSRAIIEQAKGVLIARQGIAAHAAYEQLRAQARAERRKLAAVCAELVRNAVHLARPACLAGRSRGSKTCTTPPRTRGCPARRRSSSRRLPRVIAAPSDGSRSGTLDPARGDHDCHRDHLADHRFSDQDRDCVDDRDHRPGTRPHSRAARLGRPPGWRAQALLVTARRRWIQRRRTQALPMPAWCSASATRPRSSNPVTEKAASVAVPVALMTKAMPNRIAATMASMPFCFPNGDAIIRPRYSAVRI
jgi:hypothetical protein